MKLAGPDRAAAEWVLRNGGAIKWTTSASKLADYNLLPTTQFEHYKLEEIDLTATDVIGLGFAHLSKFSPFYSYVLLFIHNLTLWPQQILSKFVYMTLKTNKASLVLSNNIPQL